MIVLNLRELLPNEWEQEEEKKMTRRQERDEFKETQKSIFQKYLSEKICYDNLHGALRVIRLQ